MSLTSTSVVCVFIMGSEVSKVRLEESLKDLLKANGTSLKAKTARAFLNTVEKAAPWFLDEGLLNIPQWDHLGEDLKKQDNKTPLPPGSLAIWTLVRG